MKELLEPPVIVGTAWFVDLFRSHVEPLAGDGSVTASWEQFEALGADAAANDAKRELALLRAINGAALPSSPNPDPDPDPNPNPDTNPR